MLQAEGFDVSCDPDLLDPGLPYGGSYETSLGDRLGHLAQSIQGSTHTAEAVAALSELTAPGDGVLQRVVEVLDTTADWWQDLGDPADPHYANRLRHIAQRLDSYALEIRSMRGEIADRHTAHPQKLRARTGPSVVPAPSDARVSAARATSPNAVRKASGPPPVSSAPSAPQPPRPSSVPGR
ncbi:hypothetical protein [Streptomyces sp. CL12]|uniref:hypothetical protein n=1 Tax=Streptomyces sp. CL12 TaxID=3391744 RepID=UPI003A803425